MKGNEGEARLCLLEANDTVVLRAETYGPAGVLCLKRCWAGYVISAIDQGRETFSWFTTDLENAMSEFVEVLAMMLMSGTTKRSRAERASDS